MNGKRIRCLKLSRRCTHLSSTVSQIFEPQVQKTPFSRTAAHIFVSPGDAPATITQYVAWMERHFNACQTPRSMYLSICNSFRVIRCLSQIVSQHVPIYLQQFPRYVNRKCKKRHFHVPLPTFLFPLETPLRLSCNMLHRWKDNSMLAKSLAA